MPINILPAPPPPAAPPVTDMATPEQVRRRREMADALLANATRLRPINSIWEGLAQMGQAGLAGWQGHRADQAQAEAQKAASADAMKLAELLSGGGGAALPAGGIGAPRQIAPVTGGTGTDQFTGGAGTDTGLSFDQRRPQEFAPDATSPWMDFDVPAPVGGDVGLNVTPQMLGRALLDEGEPRSIAGQTTPQYNMGRYAPLTVDQAAPATLAPVSAPISGMSGADALAGGAGQDTFLEFSPQDMAGALRGGGRGFRDRLGQAENEGRYGGVNDYGYAGKYQFGDDALVSAGVYRPGARTGQRGNQWDGRFAIPGFPQVRTLDDFLASPGAQEAAGDAHFSFLDKEIERRGLADRLGQTVGGVPVTQDSLRAMMHLGGPSGAERFIESGGRRNPSDAFGTSLADYGQAFGGGSGSDTMVGQSGGDQFTEAQGMAQALAGGSQRGAVSREALMMAAQLLSNPWASPGAQALAAGVFERAMEQQPQMETLSGDALSAYGLPSGSVWQRDPTTGALDELYMPDAPDQDRYSFGAWGVGDQQTGQVTPPAGGGARTMTPEEVAQAGFAAGTVIQVKPDGTYDVLQKPSFSRADDGTTVNQLTGERSGAPVANFDDQDKMRRAYITASGEYVAVRDAYGRIQAAASQDDPTGASDIAMIFSFMKMLDPGSVVRESEYATAQNAGGVPQTVRAWFNRMLDGQKLDPDVRAAFLQQAERQFAGASERQAVLGRTYTALAEQYGFDPARIVLDMSGGLTTTGAATGGQGGGPAPALAPASVVSGAAAGASPSPPLGAGAGVPVAPAAPAALSPRAIATMTREQLQALDPASLSEEQRAAAEARWDAIGP